MLTTAPASPDVQSVGGLCGNRVEVTFLGCAGDGEALPFLWRGARLCRGCLRRELAPGPSKKA